MFDSFEDTRDSGRDLRSALDSPTRELTRASMSLRSPRREAVIRCSIRRRLADLFDYPYSITSACDAMRKRKARLSLLSQSSQLSKLGLLGLDFNPPLVRRIHGHSTTLPSPASPVRSITQTTCPSVVYIQRQTLKDEQAKPHKPPSGQRVATRMHVIWRDRDPRVIAS